MRSGSKPGKYRTILDQPVSKIPNMTFSDLGLPIIRYKVSQQELAEKMNKTQAVIARMEGGSFPSVGTLECLAAATCTHLRVSVESVVK